jgi:SAM-dependent methyltransferase
VAQAVVEMAALSPADQVIDLACGTGNAALLAAVGGARVVGIDAAPRLLEVARERARAQGVDVDFREGDLLDLPLDDGTADVVLSVFVVIFAPQPAEALREVRRVMRCGGRALLSAWIPAGPIDAMLAAMGRILGRVTPGAATSAFPMVRPSRSGPACQPSGPRTSDDVLRRARDPRQLAGSLRRRGPASSHGALGAAGPGAGRRRGGGASSHDRRSTRGKRGS